MLGSEAPVDDIPREIEILNQIIQDPTIDGLILTTPQVGAYDDIVKKLEAKGIPVATTNSFDADIYNRNGISHTGQDRVGGGDRRRGAGQVPARQGGRRAARSSSRRTTTLGNVEVNNRVTAAFEATVKALNAAGTLDRLQGRRRARRISASTSTRTISSARSSR